MVAPKLLLRPWGEGSTQQQYLQKQFVRKNGLSAFRHSFKMGVEETHVSFPLTQTSTAILSSEAVISCNWASLQHIRARPKKHLWLNKPRY